MTVANDSTWSNNASMEFVSLAGRSTTAPESPQVQQNRFADWGQTLLGVNESGIKSKFDVSGDVVRNELMFALGSLRRGWFQRNQQFDEGGVLSEVSSTIQGDWWGPLWLSLTLSTCLIMSKTAPGIMYTGSFITGSALFTAFTLPAVYILYLSYMFRFLTRTVVRDPTFFGTEKQREKFVSIAGYSLAPLVAFMLVDIVCAILGMNRDGLIHWVSLTLTGLPSAHYLHKRLPLQAIGGYADGWDRRSTRLVFWTAYIIGFFIFITAIQTWFI